MIMTEAVTLQSVRRVSLFLKGPKMCGHQPILDSTFPVDRGIRFNKSFVFLAMTCFEWITVQIAI